MISEKTISTPCLFSTQYSLAGHLLDQLEWPWQALPLIGKWILQLAADLPQADYEQVADDIWVAKSAVVAPSASLNGPLIIGPQTEIRHCAFIRGNALVGSRCVVGNSTELKNVILFDQVQVPHFNYIGDSILGYKAHLGAGAITSNVKSDKSNVKIRLSGAQAIDTGLRKFGALIGDQVEVGCNSVLNPGSIIGCNSHIYPVTMVRGFVPADTIYKNNGTSARRI